MKTKDQLKALFENPVYGGSDSVISIGSLPPTGRKLTVIDIDEKDFERPIAERDFKGPWKDKLPDGAKIGDKFLFKYIAVSFAEGGSLSVNTLLRSPELTWPEEVRSKSDKCLLLQGQGLAGFRYKEPKEGKNGSYSIYHCEPQTFESKGE